MLDSDSPAIVVALGREHPAATIYEAIGKRGEVGPSIFPVVLGAKLSGVAHTVRCPAGDARGIWLAIAQAPEGSVIVVDHGGSPFTTAIGGTSVKAAMKRGLAGFVVNGAVRDVAEIKSLGLPVFASGISLRGTQKAHDGWHGETVAIGAAVVSTGDLVVGDDDGVVIVPQSVFPSLAERLERQSAREREIDSRVEAGESVVDILGLR
jgi:4-hydroxy-4-methyl-2-oxoglutarate aldolase